jgi:hypothetical protein
LVKLGNLEEPVVALVDYGLEINLMSRKLYEQGEWPIDYVWLIRVAKNSQGGLNGRCSNVSIMIGNVKDEQNFFIKDNSTHPIILGQPFITTTRMETKVMDNRSTYARIRSHNGRQTVQFLTIFANHERNQDDLKTRPLPKVKREFDDNYHDHMRDFHHLPL